MSKELSNQLGGRNQSWSSLLSPFKKAHLQTIAALTIFAALFVVSASSWVGFARSMGGPVGLFTQTDYTSIAMATRIVSSGQGARLYDFSLQLEEQQALRAEGYISLGPEENRVLKYPYPYAPFIAVLWSPLAAMSPLAGMALWDLLNLAAYVIGLWLVLASLSLPKLTRLLLLLGGITCFPLIVNLEQGQSSGIVMLGLAAGVAFLKRGQDLPAGLALGLLVLKLQWLPVIVLVLLIRRRWWSVLGMAITGSVMMGITVATLGTSWIADYLNVLQRAQLWARDLALDPWYSHSLSGGLTALLGQGTDEIVRNLDMVALIASALLLYFIWRKGWHPNTERWDGAMAITVLLAILTNPQVNTHDLCLLALPAALGVSYFQGTARLASLAQGQPPSVSASPSRIWYGLLWAAYVAPALFLPQVFNLPIRATTLIMITMLGLLAYTLLRAQKTIPTPTPSS